MLIGKRRVETKASQRLAPKSYHKFSHINGIELLMEFNIQTDDHSNLNLGISRISKYTGNS